MVSTDSVVARSTESESTRKVIKHKLFFPTLGLYDIPPGTFLGESKT